MNVQEAWQLDVSTLETLDDVKVILDGLNLTTYADAPGWENIKKYFKQRIEIPQVLPTEEELRKEMDAKGYGELENE